MEETHSIFTGSLVALVTPMEPNGGIDYINLEKLIEWHIACGTDGIVIGGTTGESSLLGDDELVELVAKSIQFANKRIPIIVGCGSTGTDKAIALVSQFNPLQPDGYLGVTPYYVKPMQRGLEAHFKMLADACNAPLILYNVPSRTGVDMVNQTVVNLAKHPNIVGIKDATGDIRRGLEMMAKIENFKFLSGDDETAFDYMLQGGDGVISVTANIVPAAMARWCNLLNSGNVEDKMTAKAIFEQIMPLHQTLFAESNPIPVKWGLVRMGKIASGIRLPLTAPELETQQKIVAALEKCNVEMKAE